MLSGMIMGRMWAVSSELAEMAQRLIEAEGLAAIRRGLAIHAEVSSASARAAFRFFPPGLAISPISRHRPRAP